MADTGIFHRPTNARPSQIRSITLACRDLGKREKGRVGGREGGDMSYGPERERAEH